jgi:flagellar M-ring protein FliF
MDIQLSPAALPGSLLPMSTMERLAAMPLRSKLALACAVLLLAALLLAGIVAGRQPEWRLLYTSLSDKDGGAVIAALAQMNVPHKFSDGGASILVPAHQVHDVRLRLASQGLPKGGTVGFELMENQKFGVTQFQERLNFQRGLEGELARSIMALSAVQSARVHLALPNQTAFLREQQKPSASVLLTLYGGRALERGQIAGIVHLVASSVPELQPKSVSVLDQSGALLSQLPGEVPNGLDAMQLQYVRQAEQSLSQRILGILEPIVGAGNVKAQVTADIDFTQSEWTAEVYSPNQGQAPAAVRSQHLSEAPGGAGSAAGNAAGNGPGGSPGALSNQPPGHTASPVNGAPQALSVAGASVGVKRDAVTNYEVDKTVKVVRNATGALRRLSAAIIVNHASSAGPDGKPVVAPLAPAQMEQINALVREAIGFNKERGDSVQVVNAPFSVPLAPAVAEVPLWKQPETIEVARSLGPWLGLPVLALIIVLGLVRPAVRAARQAQPRMLEATVQDPISLDAPQSMQAPAKPALLPTAQAAKLQSRDAQLENIRQLARQNPATVANVVRDWANQPT